MKIIKGINQIPLIKKNRIAMNSKTNNGLSKKLIVDVYPNLIL